MGKRTDSSNDVPMASTRPMTDFFPMEFEAGPLSKDGDYMKLSRKRAQERKAAAKKHQDWLDEERYK